MATFNRIAGQEPSTVSFKARTIQHTQNSSAMQQEIVTLGDSENPLSVARVSSAAPKSTDAGLIVRLAGGPSTAADCLIQTQGNSTVIQGTSPWVVGGNSSIRANLSSTAADNPVLISGNSTVVQGTSPWVVSATRINIGSTAADNAVVISGNSTAIIQGNSTVVQAAASNPWIVQETMNAASAPSSASSGVIVRQVVDNILTVASSNAFGTSTTFSIQSSAASLRSYVTAYSITSTVQSRTKVAFYSGSTMIAPVVLAALSSAIIGVNIAVAPPGYLFRTKSAGALSLNTGNSSIAGFVTWVSYFRAP